MKTFIPVNNYSFDGVPKGIITVPLTQQIVEDASMVGAASYKANHTQVFETVAVNYVSPATGALSCGGTLTFSAGVTGALLDNAVVWSSDGGTWSQNTWTAPAQAGIYTITATSHEDATIKATAKIMVFALPVATSLTALAGTIPTGTQATLTPVFTGGTGEIDNGIGLVTSGVPVQTGSITAITTFTLKVTNLAGATSTKTVQIKIS